MSGLLHKFLKFGTICKEILVKAWSPLNSRMPVRRARSERLREPCGDRGILEHLACARAIDLRQRPEHWRGGRLVAWTP